MIRHERINGSKSQERGKTTETRSPHRSPAHPAQAHARHARDRGPSVRRPILRRPESRRAIPSFKVLYIVIKSRNQKIYVSCRKRRLRSMSARFLQFAVSYCMVRRIPYITRAAVLALAPLCFGFGCNPHQCSCAKSVALKPAHRRCRGRDLGHVAVHKEVNILPSPHESGDWLVVGPSTRALRVQ
jgi:hypothetical protein